MDSAKLNDWMQVIGIFAVVASLVFVGLQMKQAQEIATVELLNDAGSAARETAALLTDNADSWYAGCSGDELSGEDQLRFAHTHKALTLIAYTTWRRYAHTDITSVDGQSVINAYAANMHRYPGFRSMRESTDKWDINGRQYRDDYIDYWLNAISKRISELEQLEPEPDAPLEFCGRL